MYAVVRTGGKQYRVAKDSILKVESLAGDVGSKLTLGEVLLSATALEFAYSQASTAMKGVIMAFWYLAVTFGNLWVLLANVAQHHPAVVDGLSDAGVGQNAFFMFFFAGFAFLAALAFAAYARIYPMQDNYRAV